MNMQLCTHSELAVRDWNKVQASTFMGKVALPLCALNPASSHALVNGKGIASGWFRLYVVRVLFNGASAFCDVHSCFLFVFFCFLLCCSVSHALVNGTGIASGWFRL
jgi:hypothetical protein